MSLKLLACLLMVTGGMLSFLGFGASQKFDAAEQRAAARVLHSYVEMRLRDADWSVYSKLIMWPDEPSWDCHWVTSSYHLGSPTVIGKKVRIPVTYTRIGVFCGDFEFTANKNKVITDYELV